MKSFVFSVLVLILLSASPLTAQQLTIDEILESQKRNVESLAAMEAICTTYGYRYDLDLGAVNENANAGDAAKYLWRQEYGKPHFLIMNVPPSQGEKDHLRTNRMGTMIVKEISYDGQVIRKKHYSNAIIESAKATDAEREQYLLYPGHLTEAEEKSMGRDMRKYQECNPLYMAFPDPAGYMYGMPLLPSDHKRVFRRYVSYKDGKIKSTAPFIIAGKAELAGWEIINGTNTLRINVSPGHWTGTEDDAEFRPSEYGKTTSMWVDPNANWMPIRYEVTTTKPDHLNKRQEAIVQEYRSVGDAFYPVNGRVKTYTSRKLMSMGSSKITPDPPDELIHTGTTDYFVEQVLTDIPTDADAFNLEIPDAVIIDDKIQNKKYIKVDGVEQNIDDEIEIWRRQQGARVFTR